MYKNPKQNYTVEFKQEAVRQVEAEGKSPAQVVRDLGISEQMLSNWHRAAKAGKLTVGKPITPEQMEMSRLKGKNARLKMELEIAKKGGSILHEAIAVRFAWIYGPRGSYPWQARCDLLGGSTSGYADWKKCGGATHWLSHAPLLALIRSVHAEYRQAYGSPRITEELKSRGIPVSRDRVKRLMKANGIHARHKRRYKATTDSMHAMPVAPNRLDRQFVTSTPDHVWTADITYVPTCEGWLYLQW